MGAPGSGARRNAISFCCRPPSAYYDHGVGRLLVVRRSALIRMRPVLPQAVSSTQKDWPYGRARLALTPRPNLLHLWGGQGLASERVLNGAAVGLLCCLAPIFSRQPALPSGRGGSQTLPRASKSRRPYPFLIKGLSIPYPSQDSRSEHSDFSASIPSPTICRTLRGALSKWSCRGKKSAQ